MSVTMPSVERYFQAWERIPPLHPMSPVSQETKSSGDRTTLTEPLDATANLSLKASEAAKAQQDPHLSWFLMG